MSKDLEFATLAGGCFWCIEAVYENLIGIIQVLSGYTGGNTNNPTYNDVCTGQTGHAEVVRIKFDPAIVTYSELLHVFFNLHDPTTLNRQGPDIGTQYRSAIFYHSEVQQLAAQDTIKDLTATNIWGNPIVTTIEPASIFYIAEEYHQKYYQNNTNLPYCQILISPKLSKLRSQFTSLLRNV